MPRAIPAFVASSLPRSAVCVALCWVAAIGQFNCATAKVIAPQITQSQSDGHAANWMSEGAFKTLQPVISGAPTGAVPTQRPAAMREIGADGVGDGKPVGMNRGDQRWTPVPLPLPPASLPVRPSAKASPESALHRQIVRAATIHSVDPYLVKAVAWAESRNNPRSVSSAKAVGLMQVLPSTASYLGLKTVDSTPLEQLLKDPWVSLVVGTRYLSDMLKRFGGRTDLALAAYNAGPTAVERAGMRIPDIPETQNYVRRVLDYYTTEKMARTLSGVRG